MKVAILGAGKVGTAIARVSLEAGHEVKIAGSGPADDIRLLVDIVAPGANAASAQEAVEGADLVVLAVPAPKFQSLNPTMLNDRVVVDAINYWPDTDGAASTFTDTALSSSEVVARHLSGARLVKTLNHIGYHDLETDQRPVGDPDRRALAVISNDAEATALVGAYIDSLGYDPVIAGPLELGRLLEPGTPIFTGSLNVDAMNSALGAPMRSGREREPVAP